MGRDDKYKKGNRDPESRQGTGRAAAGDGGRSGYGSESVRPYLRAQLRLKELLGGVFDAPNPWNRGARKGRTPKR